MIVVNMAKNNIVLRIVTFFRTASKFIFEDMWRITGNDVSGLRRRSVSYTHLAP